MKTKFYSFVQKVLRPPLKLVFHTKYYGSENEPSENEGPYIIASNHICNVDPIFLCGATDKQQPHFMAKKELFKIPLLKGLISKLGAYPVDRGGADVKAIRHSVNLLENGKCLGIFPQGHRYKGEDPRTTPVKSGIAMLATKTHAQILPCFIKTKKNKVVPFFTKVEIIVGKPIKFEELNYNPEEKGEYVRISNYIFERICSLEHSLDEKK